jgi:adenine-specific DNA-methyltransferase
MQNLYNELIELLEQDPALIIEDKLNKALIIDRALKLDSGLLKLLLSSPSIKKHFFQEIEGVHVFDKIAFQRFVNTKQFLPDSYTQFKNKIGLSTNNENYLTDSREVVLVWPHKDCVLEGGQTKDDSKRDEIFYNQTLAPDDIDRLTTPKVLTNWKRYDKNGEHPVTKVSKQDNLIIKGNNLLALHSLNTIYRGQIKLIYIDPPYNTEGDSFKYNDNFTHSSWLTFIKNRLEIALHLLQPDGVIFIQCGDEEVHYLKIVADEIFGRDNFINTVTRVSKTASNKGTHFAPSIDFILCYAKNKVQLPEFYGEVDESLYKKTETEGDRKGEKYRDDVALYQSSLDPMRGCNNQRYYIKAPDGSLLITPGNIFPEKTEEGAFIPPKTKEDKVWRWSFETYFTKKNLLVFKETKTSPLMTEKGEKAKYNIYTKSYLLDRQESGTKPRNFLNEFINRKGADYIKKLDIEFDYSKPVELIEYLINIVGTKKEDVILDFFAGSGTTAEAVIRVNNKDAGNRKFILCEQMDYIDNITIKRVQKIIEKYCFTSIELLANNQQYIDEIQDATKTEQLKKIWEQMQQSAFIGYKVLPQKINTEIKEFEALSFEEQQRFLVEVLDKNLLYVNYSEINDATNKVSEADKELNVKFYSLLSK